MGDGQTEYEQVDVLYPSIKDGAGGERFVFGCAVPGVGEVGAEFLADDDAAADGWSLPPALTLTVSCAAVEPLGAQEKCRRKSTIGGRLR